MVTNHTYNALDREFDMFWSRVNCYVVLNFPYEDRCEFVKKANCLSGTNFVPYIQLLACNFNCKNRFEEFAFVSVFLLLCVELLLLLGYAVHYYFSPALKVATRMLHMSEHLAGVTVLTLSNSMPNLFSNMMDLKEEVPVYANCLSEALFVVMFVGGWICYISPFKMNSSSTLRDLLFLLLGVLLVEYLMQTDGVMTMPEIIGILFFFLLYIIINVVDVYLVSLAMKAYKNELEELNSMKQTEEIAAKREILKKKYNSIAADHRVHILKRKPTYISNNYDKFSFITTRSTVHVTLERDSASRSDMYNMDASRNANLFTDFFCAFRPVALADWRKANMLMRIFYIVRAPAVIVCVIYIPLVDYELDKNGWSKLLNCLHIVINPAITIIFGKALMFRDRSRLWYYNIPDDCIYGFYSFAITIPIAIFTFWHSRTSAPPAYHWLYIIMNLTGSMFLTFHCACEISLIMDVCGHILKVPSDFMGVTVKAVADSIPDLIVNTSMALLGYEKMAYAASIGSSFCALILTTSTVMAAKSLTGKIVTASSMTGRYGDNAYILIILGILSTLLWTALLNFNARRSVGLFSMFIYLLYLIFVVLIRAGIIHQFAYDSFLSDAYEP